MGSDDIASLSESQLASPAFPSSDTGIQTLQEVESGRGSGGRKQARSLLGHVLGTGLSVLMQAILLTCPTARTGEASVTLVGYVRALSRRPGG